MRHNFPYARSGQVIGLLGGSFDPAHNGHVHISEAALKRFGLDRVWWMVSPGNPLKVNGPASMARRVEYAKHLVDHPRIEITDIEAQIGTRYTAQTLKHLQALYPHVTFVWLMGADNLAQFDQWRDWQNIMSSVAVGVIARPGDRVAARTSKAAKVFAHSRLSARASKRLAKMRKHPKWCFINVPMSAASSTKIRKSGGWT